jgi:predicted DNA-binding transcriptional regulator YafY
VRRADRLFQIVQYLRGRRLTTAAQLARWLQISERTVYRDVRDLSLSGVPVEGEAGVGYRLSRGFDLPPIMFSLDEVEALVTGARMVEAWGGKELASHARSAMAKIALALPKGRREEIERTRLYAPDFHVRPEVAGHLDTIRQAILKRRKLRMDYADGADRHSQRMVRPLAAAFWGGSWTVSAWCESRQDFRTFRLDRMRVLELTAEPFADEPGKMLDDFMEKMRREEERRS